MMFYDKIVSLLDTISIINSSAKILIATFQEKTQKVVHIITIYKPPKMQIFYFISILETILQKILINCPTIVTEILI